jgi:ABC-type nickel/cobalt efflux system permease component RcnA
VLLGVALIVVGVAMVGLSPWITRRNLARSLLQVSDEREPLARRIGYVMNSAIGLLFIYAGLQTPGL